MSALIKEDNSPKERNLEESIRKLEGIDNAKVMLIAEGDEKSVTVMIKAKKSSKVNKGQIEKVKNLLLNAVKGLKAENIKIIDTESIEKQPRKSPVPEATKVKTP